MPSKSKNFLTQETTLHTGRFLIAFFALIVAAVHLADSIPMGSFQAPAHAAGGNTTTISHYTPSSSSAPMTNYLGFWINLEVIAYTLIAVVFLLGLRTWYLPAAIFNAFNLGIYLLSGIIPIPGITGFAFANHLQLFSGSLTGNLLSIGWIAILILSIALLKYDPGSKLDALLVTKNDNAKK